MFVPKLVTTLRTYDRRQFGADLAAGVVVGIVALPLAIAFGIASGVTPEKGLYTAIIAGFLISALGGSRVQIGGPTGAFVVIIYGIVQRYGVEGLTLATFMAGGILIAFGLARLGAFIRFVPHPLITGFTAGIATIIASGQVKDLLGLRMGAVPAEFVEKWVEYARHAATVTPAAAGVAALALAILGAVALRLAGGPLWLLLAPAVLVTVVSALGYGDTRFRQAADVSIAVLAGLGAAALLDRRRAT